MKTKLFILLAICFSACQSAKDANDAGSSSFNLDSVKMHIADMNKVYTKRFTTSDRAFFEERYTKDAAVYPPNERAIVGIDSIAKYFYVGDGMDMQMEFPQSNIFGNGDYVVEDGTYNFPSPDGSGASLDKGKFMAVWKQEDGKWKLYREIWNSDMPPMAH